MSKGRVLLLDFNLGFCIGIRGYLVRFGWIVSNQGQIQCISPTSTPFHSLAWCLHTIIFIFLCIFQNWVKLTCQLLSSTLFSDHQVEKNICQF